MYSLPQKSEAAIKWLEKKKHLTSPPEKETLQFYAIWKNDQKIIGGAVATVRVLGGLHKNASRIRGKGAIVPENRIH